MEVVLLIEFEAAAPGRAAVRAGSLRRGQHQALLARAAIAPDAQCDGLAGLAAFQHAEHVVEVFHGFVVDGGDDIAAQHFAAVAAAEGLQAWPIGVEGGRGLNRG